MPSATEYMEMLFKGVCLRYAARTASESVARETFLLQATMEAYEAKTYFGAPPPDGLPELLGMDIAWTAL